MLSLIALDNKGRKFTNCTSVRPEYEIRGDTFINFGEGYDSMQTLNKYNLVKNYVQAATNEPLLTLRQKFDEEKGVTFSADLQSNKAP